MKVVVANSAGFCRGVRLALEATLEALQKRTDGEEICTYGPLIHNRQVLSMLEERGIREAASLEACAGKKVVIRAHGIPPEERQALRQTGAQLIDATCTRVAKVHGTIKRHARRGFHTVIVGDADHAEVIGLMGYTEGRGVVINRPEQVDALPESWPSDGVLLVAQTTQNEEIFQEVQSRFLSRYPGAVVRNTICGSTHERQAEVRQMCAQVEAMVIVGGRHSGNTVRLAEVASECGTPTYHVETEADLNREEMARYSRVGVSAGASTPNWIIRNVVEYLEAIEPEDSGLKLELKRLAERLAYGNAFIAIGAGLLPLAVEALTGVSGSWTTCLMAAFYAFAMHSLNIYTDRNAIQLNDPDRAAFYYRWRSAFTGLSVAAVFGALWIALSQGAWTFVALGVLILLGVLYAVPLNLPARWEPLSVLKIKDIPTSKTFSVPIAWASVTVLVPNLYSFDDALGQLLYAAWIVLLMVFVRTTLLDLLAVQGDRLVGRETLVVLVGEARTARFVRRALILLAASLLVGPLVGLSTLFAFLLLPIVGLYGWHLRFFFQNRLKEDPIFESLIEFVVIGAGLLGFVWNLLA